MKLSRNLVIAFALGAVAASLPGAFASDPVPGHVVALDQAPKKAAPSGKTRVWTLADKSVGAQHAFLAVLEMDASAAVPLHRDQSEEYIYVLDGGGTITIDGVDHEIAPGHAVFMPANSEVKFTATDKGPTRVLQVFAPLGSESKYDAWQ